MIKIVGILDGTDQLLKFKATSKILPQKYNKFGRKTFILSLSSLMIIKVLQLSNKS